MCEGGSAQKGHMSVEGLETDALNVSMPRDP